MYPNLMRWLTEGESGLELDLVEDDAIWELTVDNPAATTERLDLDGDEVICFHGPTPGEAMAAAEAWFAALYGAMADRVPAPASRSRWAAVYRKLHG